MYTWDEAPVKILKYKNEISEIAVYLEDSCIIGFEDIKDPVLIQYRIDQSKNDFWEKLDDFILLILPHLHQGNHQLFLG
jgi:hypothetical protein